MQAPDLTTTAPKQKEHVSGAVISAPIQGKTPMHTIDALKAAERRPNDVKNVRVILIYAPMPFNDASGQQETATQHEKTVERATVHVRDTDKSSFKI